MLQIDYEMIQTGSKMVLVDGIALLEAVLREGAREHASEA